MTISFSLTRETEAWLKETMNVSENAIFVRKISGVDFITMSVLVKEAISQTLKSAFPLQFKHFKIDNVGSNQYGMNITVRPADEVGVFLYYGTQPHTISPHGMALKFPDASGEIIYRNIVDVEGIKPLKPTMDALVDEAAFKVMLVMK